MMINERSSQHWRNRANCVDSPVEIWDYPGGLHPRDVDIHECLQYCHSCPVARDCARDAALSMATGVIRAGIAIPNPGSAGAKQARAALQLLAMTGNLAQARRSAIERIS